MTQTTYPPVPEDFKLYFYTLGDINKDGVIDNADLALMKAVYGKADTDADINGDGKVSLGDLVILSANIGKDIVTEWHKTYDKQQAEILAAETTGAAVVPWYIEWARELASLQAKNTQAYTMWQDPALQSFMDSLKVLSQMPDLFWKGNIENADDMLDAQINASLRIKASIIASVTAETPAQDVTDQYGLNQTLYDMLYKRFGFVMGAVPLIRVQDDETASKQLDKTASDVYNAEKDATIFNMVIDDLSLGSVSFQKDFIALASKAGIWDTMMTTPISLRYQLGLVIPATQWLNTQFTPYIPGVGDLVRMLANAKITPEDYAETMLLNGYDDYWQAKYWEAHWTKPGVGDALLSFRRGRLTDDELDKLFQNADLDPTFKDIWQDRKYIDLNMGVAHTLYDIGLIDDAKLLDVAKRQGFFLDDAALVAESIKSFPVRRLKYRVLLALASGYGANQLDAVEVAAGVAKLGYSQSVVDWIMYYGTLRLKMTANKVGKAPKTKLLSLGDLKAAYIRGLLTEDVFRTELLLRNYALDEIQILLTLMSDKQTVEMAGGKMYALSVSELLDAWRYQVITEDALRNKLLARGLPLDELNTLIETKRVQWKITPLAGATQPGTTPAGGATPI